jgi:catechol 2,3-dioxygenase-like lactoylglutathione lyase family enzyme
VSAPRCRGVLEACLYASNLDEAARFYAEVIGLQPFASERGRHVFFRTGADTVFLLFNPERTRQAIDPSVGTAVPTHGATGPGHVAFTINEADLSAWRARLAHHGIEIETEVSWPKGGRSIYVRDPAGNSVELATPSLWGFEEKPGTDS